MILLIYLFLIVFLVYMFGRSYWVNEWQCKIVKYVNHYLKTKINEISVMNYNDGEKARLEYLSGPSIDDMVHSFASYREMMLKFWIWDYKKFVKNEEGFNTFYKKWDIK